MQKFWTVVRYDEYPASYRPGFVSCVARDQRFYDDVLARVAAKDLALANPGTEFLVVEIIGSAVAAPDAVWRDADEPVSSF